MFHNDKPCARIRSSSQAEEPKIESATFDTASAVMFGVTWLYVSAVIRIWIPANPTVTNSCSRMYPDRTAPDHTTEPNP